MFIPSYAALVG